MRPLRRRKPPLPGQPRLIEARYFRVLSGVVHLLREQIRARLMPRLPGLIERAGEHGLHRTDAAQPPGKRINTIMAQLRKTVLARYPQKRLEKLVRQIAVATSERQRRNLINQAEASLGVPPTLLGGKITQRVEQFIAENVSLVKSLSTKVLDEIEDLALEAMRSGERHESVSRKISERLNVSLSRARLIARDQVLSFQAELNQARQQALGVTHYTWRTAGDNRVRDTHADREGNVYSWADPPGDPEDPARGGHPGEAINCRCYAEPIFEEFA